MENHSRANNIRSRYKRERLTARLLLIFIGGVILFFVLSILLFIWFSRDLPEPGRVQRSGGFSTTFLDKDGKEIYDIYKDKNRIPVKIQNVSKWLKEGTVAIEDKDFYHHKGFSVTGIIRAAFNTTVRGRLSGGSTLTQQLIKNVLLTSERSFIRKIKEFILATEIERRYSKDEILEMYLNEAPYGGTYWGVESAAEGYFGKSASELNLVESAILAGLPQRPSVFSPFIGVKNAYVARTKDVLRRMREDGHIDKKQELKALSDLKKIKFSAPRLSIRAPHFIFYVRDQIVKDYGEKILDQGLKIKTTLSLDIQNEAEKILKKEIEKSRSLKATNGAIVVLDAETNEIVAMVGSYDYNDENFGRYNTAVALRQPGSAIKPVTYALAFEKGYTPATVLTDVKTVFPDQGDKDYVPENYDGKFRGPVQLRFALANSINITAVKLLAMVGIRDFLQKSYEMGLDTFEPNEKNLARFGLSITLGGGETRLLDLTSAYSIFARGGIRKDYNSILEIKTHSGRTIYKSEKKPEKSVLSPSVSFLISHILSDNVARSEVFGSRSFLNIPGKTVAVKTGTTNDKRDNWAVGYTKGVVVGVWVGNNDNSPMDPKVASGVTGASPIWHQMMRYALKTYKDGIIDKPDDVSALQIDSFLGGLPRDGGSNRSEYFISGTEPKAISPFYKKLKISKNTGKLANDLEIKLGEYEEKEYIVISEKDPISTDDVNRWQQSIDEWARSQSDDRFKYPTETSDAKSDDIIVSIKEPGDKSRTGNDITIKAKITTLSAVKKIEIQVDGSTVKTIEEDKKDIEEKINISSGGNHEIKIRVETNNGKSADSSARIGVNQDWSDAPPTPAPTSTPTPTP